MMNTSPRIEKFWEKVQEFCRDFKNEKLLYILPLILFSPSLFFGRVTDDYFHYCNLHIEQGIDSPFDSSLSMFKFIPNNLEGFDETMPWWIDDGFKLWFFRPLSVLTHWLDAVLWTDIFFFHHLHSLMWACLCVWVVHRLFNRIMGTKWEAVLCTLLFAVQDHHAYANGWLANRNANIAFVFGILAVDAHIRNRGENRSLVLPVSLTTLSLLSAEAGLCTMAFIGSWALFYEKNIKATLYTLSPYVVLIVIWRVVYRAMGYGTAGLTLYVDPTGSPLSYIQNIIKNVPLLLNNLWYKIPSEGLMILPRSLHIYAYVVGFISIIPLVVFFAPAIRTNKSLRFWTLSMVVAIVPVSAAFPMERLLLFAGVGYVGLLVGLLQHYQGTLAKWFLVLHLPIAFVLSPLKTLTVKAQDISMIGYESFPSDTSVTSHIVFLNGIEFVPIYASIMPLLNKELPPKAISLLSPSPDVTITRIDNTSFEMFIPTGWFERGTMATPPPKEFNVGEQKTTQHFSVKVLNVTADGQPSRVLYKMKNSLDHPDYRWMIWRGFHYEEVELDFNIGESVFFPNPIQEMLPFAGN